MNVLEVKDLVVEFRLEKRRLRALDGVSFAIAPGQTFGLVGESGSGKTVTALSIMRLLDPRARIVSGEMLLLGEDVVRKSPAAMRQLRGRHVAMVFQEPMTSLNPAFTIGEQIAESYRAHLHAGDTEARRRTVEMLERVKIPRAAETYGRYPHEFSGGMRQRVMIAMALALGPDLLIADEPTTALDVTIQAQILSLLRELQSEMGMALLFISHNLEVVAQVCDRVGVMYAAKMMEVAETASLFAAPTHPYTGGLLGSIPRRGQPLRAIPGTICDLAEPPPGCRFHPRCPSARERCSVEEPLLRSLPAADGRTTALAACHFPLSEGGG